MSYVYLLLREKDGQFYTGPTNDLERRFEDHNAGKVKSTLIKRLCCFFVTFLLLKRRKVYVTRNC
ncbi:GIY-YIG nuclease family protein [bacterium]|nr:GIY-YIG nuclease family protein [bacterium]